MGDSISRAHISTSTLRLNSTWYLPGKKTKFPNLHDICPQNAIILGHFMIVARKKIFS